MSRPPALTRAGWRLRPGLPHGQAETAPHTIMSERETVPVFASKHENQQAHVWEGDDRHEEKKLIRRRNGWRSVGGIAAVQHPRPRPPRPIRNWAWTGSPSLSASRTVNDPRQRTFYPGRPTVRTGETIATDRERRVLLQFVLERGGTPGTHGAHRATQRGRTTRRRTLTRVIRSCPPSRSIVRRSAPQPDYAVTIDEIKELGAPSRTDPKRRRPSFLWPVGGRAGGTRSYRIRTPMVCCTRAGSGIPAVNWLITPARLGTGGPPPDRPFSPRRPAR